MLAYDCERRAYVALKREKLFPGSDSMIMMSRPFETPSDQLKDGKYSAINANWKVCPACDGYAAGFVTEHYSGWSGWEQKSLNMYVYTQKWETKTSEVAHECKRCKGEAWIKE